MRSELRGLNRQPSIFAGNIVGSDALPRACADRFCSFAFYTTTWLRAIAPCKGGLG